VTNVRFGRRRGCADFAPARLAFIRARSSRLTDAHTRGASVGSLTRSLRYFLRSAIRSTVESRRLRRQRPNRSDETRQLESVTLEPYQRILAAEIDLGLDGGAASRPQRVSPGRPWYGGGRKFKDSTRRLKHDSSPLPFLLEFSTSAKRACL
jgi:hypothetical protein